VPELITTSMQEYEQLALQLAREPQKLAALKEKLVQNRDTCALFDTEKFTRNLEAAYQTMWQRHLQGATPETFDA
jgi:protein O-GlcNAc transferase